MDIHTNTPYITFNIWLTFKLIHYPRIKNPICNVIKIIEGNKPTDDGNFLFTTQEKDEFIKKEPQAVKWFRKFIGSEELINNIPRWCLWLKDINPSELKSLPNILDRVQKVKEFRTNSRKDATVKKQQLQHYLTK